MTNTALCELCGYPMPLGEDMFKVHGYSGPCPKPPLPLVTRPEPSPRSALGPEIVEKLKTLSATWRQRAYERRVEDHQTADGVRMAYAMSGLDERRADELDAVLSSIVRTETKD